MRRYRIFNDPPSKLNSVNLLKCLGGACNQYRYSIIKFQTSMMVTTPATESARACLTSRLPSNLSALTNVLPRGEPSFMATTSLRLAVSGTAIRNCLIDVHLDRYRRHASRKGEGKDHNCEYLCHARPSMIAIEAIEHSDVVVKGNYVPQWRDASRSAVDG